jgi:UPF0271 protein
VYEIYAGVLYQLGALAAIVRAEGGRMSHVKPHGALYNQAAKNPDIAEAIVAAIRDFDSSLLVFGLANGNLVDAARKANMVAIEEVFADRGYRADGSLVPRKDPGALLEDEEAVLTRTLRMATEHRVQAVSGEWVPINAQTVCLHGDGAHALAFARRIRGALETAGIDVRAAHAAEV